MKLLLQIATVAGAGTLLGLAANALSPNPARLAAPVHSAAESGAGMCATPPAPRTASPAAPASRAVPRISVAEAKGRCQACTAGFVDARSAAEFAAGHVTGAVHLAAEAHPDSPGVVDTLRAFPLVIVYDGDYGCALAADVAGRLLAAGLPDVRVLEGAWSGWLAGGGPGASGFCPLCHDHALDGAPGTTR